MCRDEFIESNLGLVHACATRFKGKGIEYDDLYSAGCVGLIKATDHFDPERGLCFSTYAVPVILGEIRRLFRDGGTVKVSRGLKELSLKINRTIKDFRDKNGFEPTILQIAEIMNLEPHQIAEAINAGTQPLSLTADNESGEKQIDIPIAPPEEKLTELMALRQIITELDETEQQIIILRFFKNKTQSETGKILNMSQVQISRKEKKILEKMRDKLQ
ncbi:MAG: sigma-70 family RNA polymerase sigma factor [Acutalibacteraceae bacterium]|nr:sigma-70 family RNA polymerase sigma factor [Acutalibacteraceae bacterium]